MTNFAILCIDDSEDDLFLLAHAFDAARVAISLYTVQGGQEAIDYLSGTDAYTDRIRYPLPNLILTDLKMPRKSGMEVLQWLRQESDLPYLPVIVLSSSCQPEDVERAYILGANAFVDKPVTCEKRKDLARLIKEFWADFNKIPPVSWRPRVLPIFHRNQS
jgi:CheY-like chemotaxis protein